MVAWVENLDEFAILIKRKRIFEVSISTLYGHINNEETGTANIILQASQNSETFSYRKIVCKINTVPGAESPLISEENASVNEIRYFLKARLPEIIFMREDIDESSVESDDNSHTYESSLHCTECDDEIETCNNCGKDFLENSPLYCGEGIHICPRCFNDEQGRFRNDYTFGVEMHDKDEINDAIEGLTNHANSYVLASCCRK